VPETASAPRHPDVFRPRPATEDDIPLLLGLVRDLAIYENLLEHVKADETGFGKWLFRDKKAEAILGEVNGVAVGYALFYTTFSTFLGLPGLYLEDLFIRPESRGKGYGTMLLREVARIMCERGYGRLEWSCLDWNTPAREFYRSLGAERLEEWTTYRLTGTGADALAGRTGNG
jgi:GNAT superfamily N-acetyltransferase